MALAHTWGTSGLSISCSRKRHLMTDVAKNTGLGIFLKLKLWCSDAYDRIGCHHVLVKVDTLR